LCPSSNKQATKEKTLKTCFILQRVVEKLSLNHTLRLLPRLTPRSTHQPIR
jgi:hypothetical protein